MYFSKYHYNIEVVILMSPCKSFWSTCFKLLCLFKNTLQNSRVKKKKKKAEIQTAPEATSPCVE